MSFWRRSGTHRTSLTGPSDDHEATAEPSPADPGPRLGPEDSVPRSRAGTAFVGVAFAAVITAALVIFMVQNTSVVEVSFLGLTTRTSLAVTLVLAALAGAMITMILGGTRILQLRRLLRERGREVS